MLRLYDSLLSGNCWKVRILLNQLNTIADLALFPYVSMAPEGGFDLEGFAAIRKWIARVEGEPGWIALGHGGPPPGPESARCWI